jgi:hypothetical protein
MKNVLNNQRGNFEVFSTVLSLIAIGLLLLFVPATCTLNPHETARKVNQAHPTCEVIDAGVYAYFSCSESDAYNSKFLCKDGRRGVLCKGIFKGYTVRWE